MSLEARGVTVRYHEGGQAALDDASLRVERGELVALAGTNGCGKSTLCRVLAGAIAPDCGAVLLDGGTLDRPVPAAVQLVQQVVEDQIVAPVVREDVAFGPESLGLDDREVARRVAAALASVGLAEYEERAIETLSGGELARVAIAGALAMDPRYLLVDEPTAQLDPVSAEGVVALLRAAADGGTGVLLVTHRLEEARHADRLELMREGTVLAEGAPQEVLYDAALLERAGLRPPPIVALVEEWRAAGREVTGQPLSLEELAEATEARAWPASV